MPWTCVIKRQRKKRGKKIEKLTTHEYGLHLCWIFLVITSATVLSIVFILRSYVLVAISRGKEEICLCRTDIFLLYSPLKRFLKCFHYYCPTLLTVVMRPGSVLEGRAPQGVDLASYFLATNKFSEAAHCNF